MFFSFDRNLASLFLLWLWWRFRQHFDDFLWGIFSLLGLSDSVVIRELFFIFRSLNSRAALYIFFSIFQSVFCFKIVAVRASTASRPRTSLKACRLLHQNWTTFAIWAFSSSPNVLMAVGSTLHAQLGYTNLNKYTFLRYGTTCVMFSSFRFLSC